MKGVLALVILVYFGQYLVRGLIDAGWDAVTVGFLLCVLYELTPKSDPTKLEK